MIPFSEENARKLSLSRSKNTVPFSLIAAGPCRVEPRLKGSKGIEGRSTLARRQYSAEKGEHIRATVEFKMRLKNKEI